MPKPHSSHPSHAPRKPWGLGLFAWLAAWTIAAAPLLADRALIVGVGTYEMGYGCEAGRKGCPNLPGIDLDVGLMVEVAQAMHFRENEIKVLLDRDATLDGIRDAFQSWLVDGTRPGDRVLFYFTGHGSQIPDRRGDEPDHFDEVLLPHDTKMRRGTLERVLVDDELGEMLRHLAGRRTFVLVDACHSVSSTRSAGTARTALIGKSYDYEGRPKGTKNLSLDASDAEDVGYLALSAAQDHEEARATANGSLFTLGLHGAVTSAAQRGDPMTLAELEHSIGEFIRRHPLIQENRQWRHHPGLFGTAALRDVNLLVRRTTDHGEDHGDAPGGDDLWDRLERIHRRASTSFSMTPRSDVYRPGQALILDLELPRDGYLNVLNVGTGHDQVVLLFPNALQPSNHMEAGHRVTIPARSMPFEIPLDLPPELESQRNLLIAVLTDEPLNLFETHSGSDASSPLAAIPARSIEHVAEGLSHWIDTVSTDSLRGYASARAVFDIRR